MSILNLGYSGSIVWLQSDPQEMKLRMKLSETFCMFRLNSGIFGIFKLSACNLNLNSSGCRASKII